MSRLFVAVWPPADVVEALAVLPRPEAAGVRWTKPERMHITLRFLGEAAEGEVADVLGAVPLPRVEAVAGPIAERLGRGVLMMPVAGLDQLARAVLDATGHLGRPPEDRPFVGHLTLARFKGRAPKWLRAPIELAWTVADIALVRVEPSGAYVNVERFPCT